MQWTGTNETKCCTIRYNQFIWPKPLTAKPSIQTKQCGKFHSKRMARQSNGKVEETQMTKSYLNYKIWKFPNSKLVIVIETLFMDTNATTFVELFSGRTHILWRALSFGIFTNDKSPMMNDQLEHRYVLACTFSRFSIENLAYNQAKRTLLTKFERRLLLLQNQADFQRGRKKTNNSRMIHCR